MSRFHRAESKSGSVLLITLIALFIVAGATIGVLMVTANALHLSDRQLAGATAFNAAESGAERAALYLRNLPYPPSSPNPIYPFEQDELDGATYNVTIYPGSENGTAFLKTFRIVSVATCRNMTKTIELVVKQSSFGRYAYFTDKETSSVTGGAIWWKAGERVDGPAHSNNRNGSNFNINYNNSNSPIFLDMVTGAGSTINYNPSRPRNESAFKRIFLDGSKGYKLNVDPILLPPSSDAQRNAAWGSQSGFPATNGVYLQASFNGGVYIRGDARLEFSLDGSGNQVLTVQQGTDTTTLTFDRYSRSITTSGPMGSGSPTSASSLGTGVIYATGDITSLSGEIADNWAMGEDIMVRSEFTIANDVNSGKTIEVTDDLIYHTRPDKTLDRTASVNLLAGTLGLVSKDIRISSTAPRDLEIDAVCLAGGSNTTSGSFYVENYDRKSTGTLRVLGGIVQKNRGPVGTFDPSTGHTISGYAKDYSYDPRMASDPPPYYPTTGQYERLSWQVLPNQ